MAYKTAEECTAHYMSGILGCNSYCGKSRGYADPKLQEHCRCYREALDLKKMLENNKYTLAALPPAPTKTNDWPYDSF
jgi:hypothetical protein